MASKALKEVVFTACRDVFTGPHALVRKKKAIHSVLQANWEHIGKRLPADTKMESILAPTKELLKEGRFGDVRENGEVAAESQKGGKKPSTSQATASKKPDTSAKKVSTSKSAGPSKNAGPSNKDGTTTASKKPDTSAKKASISKSAGPSKNAGPSNNAGSSKNAGPSNKDGTTTKLPILESAVVISTLKSALQKSAFEWTKKTAPGFLTQHKWDTPQDLDLKVWVDATAGSKLKSAFEKSLTNVAKNNISRIRSDVSFLQGQNGSTLETNLDLTRLHEIAVSSLWLHECIGLEAERKIFAFMNATIGGMMGNMRIQTVKDESIIQDKTSSIDIHTEAIKKAIEILQEALKFDSNLLTKYFAQRDMNQQTGVDTICKSLKKSSFTSETFNQGQSGTGNPGSGSANDQEYATTDQPADADNKSAEQSKAAVSQDITETSEVKPAPAAAQDNTLNKHPVDDIHVAALDETRKEFTRPDNGHSPDIISQQDSTVDVPAANIGPGLNIITRPGTSVKSWLTNIMKF